MDHPTRVVSVEIHGQEYPIRSGLDPKYVAELAAYVDDKIRAASRETPAGDTLKLAVLAALTSGYALSASAASIDPWILRQLN